MLVWLVDMELTPHGNCRAWNQNLVVSIDGPDILDLLELRSVFPHKMKWLMQGLEGYPADHLLQLI